MLIRKDLHEYSAGPVLIPKEPHKITGTSYPVTLGHEFAGIIEEVGEGVTHLPPGQRAVVRPTIFDRQCCSCKLGYEYCCENIGFIGLSGKTRVQSVYTGPLKLNTCRIWWRNGKAHRGAR
jgi:threonine dehydrogenase-like Zn-dependent dehydrogenase